MPSITRQKLDQAVSLMEESGIDVWLTFVRETSAGSDPVLPLLIEGSLTWQSALLVSRNGRKVAVVGNYDAPALEASGDWDQVRPYVNDIREALVGALDSLCDSVAQPKIGVNFSPDDDKADGLTHGMYLLLQRYAQDTRFEGCFVSAAPLVRALRARKTEEEVARIQTAIAHTDSLFSQIARFASVGTSEAGVQRFVHSLIDERGWGFGWERAGNPIVNSGPDSMVGHGIPSEAIIVSPGHIFHVDLGVVVEGYSSDIQRCWYVPALGEDAAPEDVLRAFGAVTAAIEAGFRALRPGTLGWEVDAAAREAIQDQGYPEYLHALGHQVGRLAHDGGTILGPRWERYGDTPFLPVEPGHVYTLELGVDVEGRGYLGLEEMVVVTESGAKWLTRRWPQIPLLGRW